MTDTKFNLAAALETLRKTDRGALDRLLLESAAAGWRGVDALLSAGAAIDAKDVYGWTPLHLAVRDGHTGVVEQLIAKGARIDAKDYYGSTPLHVAAKNGHSAVVGYLIDMGAAIEAKDCVFCRRERAHRYGRAAVRLKALGQG